MSQKSIFVSVVAPAYNEEKNIGKVVREWMGILNTSDYLAEVVIGNDGSTDSTKQILDELQEEFSNLKVVHSGKNGGYGEALFKAIYASRGEYVVTLDSDGQFDLADYPRLLEERRKGNYDAVTGYRTRKQDSIPRVLADRALNLIVRGLFGLSFRDTNCALKLFKGEWIRRMRIEAKSYPTPTEIMIRLRDQGARVGEIPIQHRERMGGKSHLKLMRTGWDMFLFLLYLRLKLFLKSTRIINEI